MKRYLLILVFAAMTSLACGQNVNEVHLKNGSIIKGTILEMDPANNVKIQTSDGSIFIYAMSEVDAIKQSASGPVRNNYAGGSVRKIERNKSYFYWQDTRERLTDEEYSSILNDELFDTYYSARKQFKTGRALLFAGIGCLLVAVVNYSAALESYSVEEDIIYNEGALNRFYLASTAADACFITGFIFKGIGKGRMNWVKDTYNAGRSYSSTLNLSPSLMMTAQKDLGFGVSMNFTF